MKCKECKSKINKNAKKCSFCGAYQDWRRGIQSTQFLIGFILLVVALLSIDPIKNVFAKAEIEAHIVKADSTQIFVAVKNTGNSSAALVSIKVNAALNGTDTTWVNVLQHNKFEKPILNSGDIRIFSIDHKNEIPKVAIPGQVSSDFKNECLISVWYDDLNGSHIGRIFKYRCNLNERQ